MSRSRNHGRGNRGSWGPLSAGEGRFWQRVYHRARRARDRVLIALGRHDDVAAREPRSIRWDLW